ncbi:bifunctional MaoC family dehydratase N-terminal/OB-fold nucleic acid binding domain-containing protein [Saccharomonospora iraqiensis]|uniref:bifunctional MaoC family dehydratase N-terminal/OB-fold nucleic acid binding domain-containing protein n=1 Tax=Saccharomonospora iraqiensis TaxID=52698 RepID=UPI00022E4CCF|nr:OB-fold domain-containing protein [Saccharomonospora iraqiensis]
MNDTLEQRLQEFVGRELSPTRSAQDPVNVPMIRHWVEAMGDANPIHLDDAAARATGRPGVVAPPAMAQAWTMRGYAAHRAAQDGADDTGDIDGDGDTDGTAPTVLDEMFALLDEAGFTSVVATDSDQEFVRELVPGDHLSVSETLESVSPEKTTALGTGHFLTSLRTYTDQHGDVVATQRWRILRFRPAGKTAAADSSASGGTGGSGEEGEERPLRPRPAVNRDNAFFFDACREHRLVIQRCTACRTLRHPPGPCCPDCGSFDWDTVEASGRATVYSYVVAHHPRHPAFDYPLLVAVVELAEGTRLITNLVGVGPDDVAIDMPVELEWLDADDELTLPVFRPAATGDAAGTARAREEE